VLFCAADLGAAALAAAVLRATGASPAATAAAAAAALFNPFTAAGTRALALAHCTPRACAGR
jgi:hypothetical protein